MLYTQCKVCLLFAIIPFPFPSAIRVSAAAAARSYESVYNIMQYFVDLFCVFVFIFCFFFSSFNQ